MKPKVLVVDDSATVQLHLREVLGAAGFSPVVCESIAAARKLLAEERFDLAILDVHLQDGDGVELLIQMRAVERTNRVPVLLLSSQTAVGARLRGLDGGASDYVGKPYDPAYVVKRARELTQTPGVEESVEPKTMAASRGRRVLIVDDNPIFRGSVMDELRKDGHDVIAAQSAEEALPLLSAQPVDCILMDLVLPGMNGIAATRLIRADPKTATVPLLMLTARFESQKMAEALAAGVDVFCPKEGELELLRAQVRNLLRRSTEAESSSTSSSPSSAKSEGGASKLFDQVVARSGLSSVIAAATLRRACRRAQVDPDHLDVGALTQALPFIRDALRIFLTEQETHQCILANGDADHAGTPKMAMPITAGAQLLKITPRQYEVLVLLSRGYPIKTVSRMLNISVATAKTHACTLYQRLQVKNKGEAVYTALQRGATLDWDANSANGASYERSRL